MAQPTSPMETNFQKGLYKRPMLPPGTSYSSNSGDVAMRKQVRETAAAQAWAAANKEEEETWYQQEREHMQQMLEPESDFPAFARPTTGSALDHIFKRGITKKPMLQPHNSFIGASGDPALKEKVRAAVKAAKITPPQDRERVINEMKLEREKRTVDAEREYRQRLANLQLTMAKREGCYKPAPPPEVSRDVYITEKKTAGIRAMANGVVEHKAWLQKHLEVQDERLLKAIKDRQAAIKEADRKIKAQDEIRLSRVEEMREQDRAWQARLLEITGVPSSPPHKKKRPLPASKSLPAIWDQSLDERARAEKDYWKYSKKLHETAVCAVDHKLNLPEKTQAQFDKMNCIKKGLEESKVNEKEYWKWSEKIKNAKGRGIDQSWAICDEEKEEKKKTKPKEPEDSPADPF